PALVAGCRARDPASLDAFFRTNVRYVERVIVRLTGPTPDLEDLVQTTFIQAFQSFSRFRGEASLQTWVPRLPVQVALHHARAAGGGEGGAAGGGGGGGEGGEPGRARRSGGGQPAAGAEAPHVARQDRPQEAGCLPALHRRRAFDRGGGGADRLQQGGHEVAHL